MYTSPSSVAVPVEVRPRSMVAGPKPLTVLPAESAPTLVSDEINDVCV